MRLIPFPPRVWCGMNASDGPYLLSGALPRGCNFGESRTPELDPGCFATDAATENFVASTVWGS